MNIRSTRCANITPASASAPATTPTTGWYYRFEHPREAERGLDQPLRIEAARFRQSEREQLDLDSKLLAGKVQLTAQEQQVARATIVRLRLPKLTVTGSMVYEW